ncbi:MAG: phenylalanine--tRNA ligase subunit beta [Proteobacteria bacterium]|nr:phenylalanine--tRNA ligase subunit beta [Pseudomonadota bacterium]MCL2307074.1 phenylalanine--tRNA ligase subunit beta [Pseudomonadota bacterium]
MRFSEHWLRTLVDPPLDSAALCDCLTMAGLEVEETTPAAPPFSGIVVARILDVERHPNADKLTVCKVDVGQASPLQIVCGAPNAAAGLVVPCALEGAVLPGDFHIKRTTMRGVESRGMLCSARELGISDDHSGLMPLPDDLQPGTDIRAALHLDDTFITLKLTPNRADCLSLVGVAREVAALTGAPLRLPVTAPIRTDSKTTPGIRLEAPEGCPRFAAQVIENVNPSAPTPLWMQQRLRSAGIRPISALVDITNYVMMELGQPMHAYDCRQIDGDVVVRFAKPGEKLLLLNEQTVDLTPDLLMVCDEKKPLGLAGIMGGEHTSIAPDTTNVFLEAAHFSPAAIQGKMRQLGFVSDAGHRFERGVDFELPPKAIERAAELILAICGVPGKTAVGPLVDERKTLPTRPPVRVRTARVSRILGWSFDTDAVAAVFQKLGFAFTRDGAHENEDFIVTPPSFRFDLTLEEDFIEEVARIHGYDNIPLPAVTHGQHMLALPEAQLPVAALKQRLADQGWQEILTFSFVSSEMERLLNGETPKVPPVRVHNPIAAQLDVMRTSLLPGLLETLRSNLNRKEPYLRLFEVGRIFLSAAADAAVQPYRLGGLAYGDANPEQWGTASTRRPVDFFDVKGTLEALVAPRQLTTASFDHAGEIPPALHPRRAARVLVDGVVVGWLGELHPQIVSHLEFPQAPVVFELDQETLCERALPQARPISRQPMARRDLAVVVDNQVPAQALIDSLEKVRPPHVEDIQLFDIYQGSNLPAGKKSVAILMLMRDTQRTLTDRDIDATLQMFYAALEKDHGARLRS